MKGGVYRMLTVRLGKYNNVFRQHTVVRRIVHIPISSFKKAY